MMWANEHQRDAHHDHRPSTGYRKTLSERSLGRRLIAVEEPLREGASRRSRGGPQRGVLGIEPERGQQRSDRRRGAREVGSVSWRCFSAVKARSARHAKRGAADAVRVKSQRAVGARAEVLQLRGTLTHWGAFPSVEPNMILPTQLEPLSRIVRPVSRYAEAEIPTVHGPINFVVYRVTTGPDGSFEEHVALVFGDPLVDPDDVLVRVHSECLTAEVFGSMKCDCREQLLAAIDKIREKGSGVITYLRQEGRGIGLGNKIKAYALQARGVDTVDANHQVGFESDLRTYDVAAAMLGDLGVRGVSLMTNNPRKVHGLAEHGITVIRRVSIQVAASQHSARYLATKRDRLGHLLDLISPVAQE
jgi:GTP cyclohydrolase II